MEKQVEEIVSGNSFTALKTSDMNFYYLGHTLQSPLPIQLQRDAFMHLNISDSSLLFVTGSTLNRITEDSDIVQSINIPALTQHYKVVEILPYKEPDQNNQQVILVVGECSVTDWTDQVSSLREMIASEIPNEHKEKFHPNNQIPPKLKDFDKHSIDQTNIVTPVTGFKGRINSAVAYGGGAGIISQIADNFMSFSR